MNIRTSLFGGAALGAMIACVVAPAAFAAAPAHHHHHAAKVKVVKVVDPAVKGELDELKSEVAQLKAQQDAQQSGQAQTQAQVQQLQGQLSDANARAAQAEAKVAEEIQTIPGQVDADVAKHAPKTDKIYYKGVTITLGGFAAAESVYRTKSNQADIGSNYSKIAYNNSALAHADEWKQTARQSRVSFLAQGNVNPNLQLSFYGEFDFLAGPQTANGNESNSFSPRIRNVYGAADWNDSGWHLLAGQNWSLATMNSKGITQRNEVIPQTIEAQYVPGFVWARQPQVRLTKDFDDKQVWAAVSLENPQTTFASAATGTSTAVGGITVNDNAPGISQFDSANSPSFNHVPDLIGKIAFEPMLGGAQPLHLEVFGILSNYYDRVNVVTNVQAQGLGLAPGNFTDTTWGGGIGGGATLTVVPKLLDLQFNALTGRGIGRYGAGQLPGVIVGPGGNLVAIPETMFLAGGVVHARPELDIYAYAGEEMEGAKTSNPVFGATTLHLGYGNPNATLGNCFVELGSCSPDTQSVSQVTVGFWDKVYQGSFGQFRVGLQYSHTQLRAFQGVAGANTAGFPTTAVVRPETSDDMVFTSIRYYPF